MRSQQGPSRHSTLCLVSHLVSLSTSLRSVHVQQNCYYRAHRHEFVGERRWERCLQNAKSMHRSLGPFGTCLPTRRPWPKNRATTAMLAATEHMAMQNTAARNRNARGKSSSSKKEPRGAPSFLPSAFIRAAESKGLMSPKEATPHSKRPLSAKDGTRFAQNMKKACRTRHVHAAESAPHDVQTRIGV